VTCSNDEIADGPVLLLKQKAMNRSEVSVLGPNRILQDCVAATEMFIGIGAPMIKDRHGI
jgi:hypothetical protein